MRKSAGWSIHGVDFTSRPRIRKPITLASGRVYRSEFRLDTVEEFADWASFETWLRHPGPWIAGFDFPFGLPREAVEDLGWPQQWSNLLVIAGVRDAMNFAPHWIDIAKAGRRESATRTGPPTILPARTAR